MKVASRTARGKTKQAQSRRKETFSRYDTADYLKSEEDILAYLEACMDEGGDDPALIAVALGNAARADGMARFAQETGLTRVARILCGPQRSA